MIKKIIKESIAILVAFISFTGLAMAAPENMTQNVTYQGETITMVLKRQDLRGANFELLKQNASGGYDAVTPVDERSYLGTVNGYPGAVSCGIIQDNGQFRGAVYFDRGATWFTLGSSVVSTRALEYSNFTDFQIPTASSVLPNQAGSSMYGFEMGIDADYQYFSKTSGGSVAKAIETIEYTLSVTRAIYMRDMLLRPYLGRVIVRASSANDPYSGMNDFSVALTAIRLEWNANQTDTDPDLVAGVSPLYYWAGKATVGTVGTIFGYSVNGAASTGEFNGFLRHELGHNWSLRHFTGGSPEGAGIMGGNQPGRFTGCEVYGALVHRDSRIAMGGILDDEGVYSGVELPPYASLDYVLFDQSRDSIIDVDVQANDFDANNQTTSLLSFDSTSAQGGTVIQQGESLCYIAQETFVGTDYFQYKIIDTAGKEATGVVVVKVHASGSAVQSGLIGHWELDDGSGNEAIDSSLNNFSGTLNNGVTWVDGFIGGGARFDGVDDNITLGHASSLNGKTDFTVSAWIKTSSNTDQVIIQQRNGGFNGQFQFMVNADGTLRFSVFGNSASQFNFSTSETVNDGAWHYVSAVRDGDDGFIYIDGNLTPSASGSGPVRDLVSSIGIGIGRDIRDNNKPFNGDIDDVKIYNIAKTGAELELSYEVYLNSAPVINNVTLSVSEGANAGTVVAQLSASDPDSGDTVTYEIINGNIGDAFSISASGEIQVLNTLDFETLNSYSLVVKVTDSLGASDTAVVSINLINVIGDDSDADGLSDEWELANFGTTSAQTGGGDPDGDGLTNAQEEAVDSDPNDNFDPNNASLLLREDFELGFINWTNVGGDSHDWTLENGRTPSPNTGPTSSADGNFYAYLETSSGSASSSGDTAILQSATITGSDRALLFSYHMVGSDIGTLSLDVFSGGVWIEDVWTRTGAQGTDPTVWLESTVDLSAFTGDIQLRFRAVAAGGGAEGDIAIDELTVVNYGLFTNEPPVVADANFNVLENEVIGAAVGQVTATDPDSGDILTYTITGGNTGGAFSISPQGEILVANTIDHETLNTYSLTITVTDPGGRFDTATVVISVTDIAGDDSDSDGLDDEWELINFDSTSVQNGSGDPDRDGVSNLFEYALGGNPNSNDAKDIFPTLTLDSSSRAQFQFKRDPTKINRNYTVQASSTLAGSSWVDIATSVAGATTTALPGGAVSVLETGNPEVEVTVTDTETSSSKRFFRLKITVLTRP